MAMGLFQILKQAVYARVPTFDDLNDEFYDESGGER